MADVHSKEVRSYNMSRIKGHNTKPEIIVRKFLFSKGYRYRNNDSKLPGKPDIVLKKYHIAIFVNGCFWHGHEGCRKFVIPQHNSDWWMNKMSDNQKRGQRNIISLKNAGWNVITVWECQLHSSVREEILNNVVRKYLNAI